jgi:hypothetical protein
MSKTALDKVTIMSFEDFNNDNVKKPSNYYTRSAMGDYYFYQTKDRAIAQQLCNELFGVGMYTVNACKTSKAPESQSAVGRLNSRSRQGMRKP